MEEVETVASVTTGNSKNLSRAVLTERFFLNITVERTEPTDDPYTVALCKNYYVSNFHTWFVEDCQLFSLGPCTCKHLIAYIWLKKLKLHSFTYWIITPAAHTFARNLAKFHCFLFGIIICWWISLKIDRHNLFQTSALQLAEWLSWSGKSYYLLGTHIFYSVTYDNNTGRTKVWKQ